MYEQIQQVVQQLRAWEQDSQKVPLQTIILSLSNLYFTWQKQKQQRQTVLANIASLGLNADDITILNKFYQAAKLIVPKDQQKGFRHIIQNFSENILSPAQTKVNPIYEYKPYSTPLVKKITVYFMGHDGKETIAGIPTHGHLAMRIDFTDVRGKRHEPLYISKYPVKTQAEIAKEQERSPLSEGPHRSSHIPSLKTRNGEFSSFAEDQQYLTPTTPSIEFDCTQAYSLDFDALFRACTNLVNMKPENIKFNLYTDENCSGTILKLFINNAGAPHFVNYDQIDKKLLQELSGRITPQTTWNYLCAVKNKIDDKNRTNDESIAKANKIIAEQKTFTDRFKELITFCKLRIAEKTQSATYAIDEGGSIQPLVQDNSQYEFINNNLDSIVAKLTANEITFTEAKEKLHDFINGLAEKSDREKREDLAEITTLLKTSVDSLVCNKALHLKTQTTPETLNLLQNSFYKNHPGIQLLNHYVLPNTLLEKLDAEKELNEYLKANKNDSPFNHIATILFSIEKTSKEIKNHPEDDAKNSLALWQTINTLRQVKYDLNQKKSITESEKVLIDYCDKMVNNLTAMTKDLHQLLYFDKNKNLLTEKLCELYGQPKQSSASRCISNQNSTLQTNLKSLIATLPDFAQQKIKLDESLSCKENIVKVREQLKHPTSGLFEWLRWNVFQRGKKTTFYNKLKHLTLDAKINSAIHSFAEGKIHEASLMGFLDDCYLEKTKLGHTKQDVQTLGNFTTELQTQYTAKVFNSESTIFKRLNIKTDSQPKNTQNVSQDPEEKLNQAVMQEKAEKFKRAAQEVTTEIRYYRRSFK